MRTMCIVLCLLGLVSQARATDPFFSELMQDKDRAKEIAGGRPLVKITGSGMATDSITLANQNKSIRYSSFQNLGAFQVEVEL